MGSDWIDWLFNTIWFGLLFGWLGALGGRLGLALAVGLARNPDESLALVLDKNPGMEVVGNIVFAIIGILTGFICIMIIGLSNFWVAFIIDVVLAVVVPVIFVTFLGLIWGRKIRR
jgi:hypothetical protein